jgi:hypothetical protein
LNLRAPVRFVAGILAAAATLAAGEPPPQLAPWRERMQPITPQGYIARHAARPPVIDGRLDDPAWAEADWTGDFRDIEGDRRPRPRFRTRAKILWDETHLYIGAQLEEPHVWGKLTAHDSVIFQDPDFEVFIDPDGDTHEYFEFELNALNTGWDLFLPKPYLDGGKARNEWDIPGLRSAVHVDGTINDPRDTDHGWTLEIAFPWAAFRTERGAVRPPMEDDIWRMNFSRVEWRINVKEGGYEKVPATPEDNWVWSPQGVIDMHRPEMWGLVRFSRRAPGRDHPPPVLAGKAARDLALDVYHAQREFRQRHRRWAASLEELGWTAPAGAADHAFTAEDGGFVFTSRFLENGRSRVWRIRADRRLTLD